MVLEHNKVVQIVLNNGDSGSHPFHLHGHNFQLVDRAPSYGPTFYNYLDGDPVPYDPSNHSSFPAFPARRDTFVLPPQGYFVIRFVADNPGVWFFHCHIDWHLSQGLGMLMIEAPTQIQKQPIPQQHYDECKAAGIPMDRNAAANSQNFLDLSGQNKQPGWLPDGFTPRGIVALVFSALSAILGMAFIVVYGLSDLRFKPSTTAAAAATASAASTEEQREGSTEYRD
jgi:iron transport multicopper oxidase